MANRRQLELQDEGSDEGKGPGYVGSCEGSDGTDPGPTAAAVEFVQVSAQLAEPVRFN